MKKLLVILFCLIVQSVWGQTDSALTIVAVGEANKEKDQIGFVYQNNS